MLDVVISSDSVVTPWGVQACDVAIQGEKIVAVQSPGTLTSDVVRRIDAKGKIVIPGGIEPHAHIAWATFTTPEKSLADVDSRAAVFGGTTTICDFATQYPGTARHDDLHDVIAERSSVWEGNSYADYCYHCWLFGAPSPKILSQVKEVIQEGFPSIKLFTTNISPLAAKRVDRLQTMGQVLRIMEQIAANGGMTFIHAEDDEIIWYMYERLEAENRAERHNIHLVHNNLSEDIAYRKCIRVAEETGAAVYFAHTSAKESVWNIREARSRGFPIYGETIHNYCVFTADRYKEPDGMRYHTYPSLKGEGDREALWDGLFNGAMSTMATDQVDVSLETKTGGDDIYDITGGHQGIETRVGVTYAEGVVKRGMSLQRFVDVTSTNAAKILGLYPRKGIIAPGSDADIVFIDPSVRKRLSLADLHSGNYSIWEGWEAKGWPVFTMVRGKVVVEEGQLVGNKGHGQLIRRKIAPEVLRKPVC